LAQSITDWPELSRTNLLVKHRYARVDTMSRIPIDDLHKKQTMVIEIMEKSFSRDPIIEIRMTTRTSVPTLHPTKLGKIAVYKSTLRPFIKMIDDVASTTLIPANKDKFKTPHCYKSKTFKDLTTKIAYQVRLTKESSQIGFSRNMWIQMVFEDQIKGSITFPWHTTSWVLRELKATYRLTVECAN
jgi:hypothetical protein